MLAQPLDKLDEDVAREAVADDDVGFARDKVVTLDVADEVEVAVLEQLVGLLGNTVALALFRAVAEYGNGGLGYAEGGLGVDRAHDRELEEVLGGAVRIRPEVNDEAVGGDGKAGATSGALDALQAAQHDRARHETSAAVASSDH